MAFTWTITGNYTLDESSGLQTGVDGTPSGSPRPDNDMPLSQLSSDAPSFYSYLFTTIGLDPTFPTNVGVAESSTSFINVISDSGNLSSLSLTNSTGGSFDGTQDSGLMTTSGHEIFLTSALNGQAVVGMYDSDGVGGLDSVAFALYMKPDGALDTNVSVQMFSVTFTALQHSDTSNPDEAVDLLNNVFIHSTGELHISFDNMPSGANLFNDAAESPSGGGIFVFGETPITDSSGKYTNASDYISTSQGGQGATIGVDSQMFNPDEGAYFTYVRDIDDNYLSGLKKGLSATEADYAQNMQYASLIDAHTASVHISQIQDANNPAGVTITAFELNSAYKGQALLDHRGGMQSGGSTVAIDHVFIYAADGHTVLADSSIAGAQNGITISISSGGIANVQGLSVSNVIEWHTTSVHDQVLIHNSSPAGKFDIGGFDIKEGAADTHSLAGAFVEDSGPKIGDSDGVSSAIANAIVSYPGDTDSVGHTDVSTVTNSLGGAVGTDPNSSPYDLTSWTPSVSFNGVTLTAVPNASGGAPVTGVSYWQDTNGLAGIQTSGATPDTEFYRLTLNESGAGTYTFSVLRDPAVVEQHFGFGAQPSGQNLFGIIPAGPAVGTAPNATIPAGGLLFFNSNVHLDSDGKYISSNSDPSLNSGTVNTSQGGGAVSIGYGANNYTAVGQNAFFVFADNPNTAAVSGLGLNATSADDADTVNFNGLNATSIASVDIVKTVSSTEAGVTLKAWNLDDSKMNMSDNSPTNETRDFLTNPTLFGNASAVDIKGIQVFRVTHSGQTTTSTLVYAAQDTNNDHNFAGAEITTNNGNVTVVDHADGTVTITGMDTNADYTLKYNTVAPHDMAEVLYAAGSYNIGGFSLFSALDTPDQALAFTARVTDGDGDTATANWHIGIDGTGLADNGLVSGVVV